MYLMALTNVRACVLALDSGLVTFLTDPTPNQMDELIARQGACRAHWELVATYSSSGDEVRTKHLREARWLFGNWNDLIAHLIKSHIALMVTLNEGDVTNAQLIYTQILEGRKKSGEFRDKIEHEIYEAWD